MRRVISFDKETERCIVTGTKNFESVYRRPKVCSDYAHQLILILCEVD